jgi:sugar phosphate isomerase/epimerase
MATRRDFLKQMAVASAGATVVRSIPARAFEVNELPYKISLAQWSLNKSFFTKKIDALDFAKIARNEFSIEAVEYVNQFFKDKAKDQSYLKELKNRADGEGVRSLLIMCDLEGRLGDPDDTKRSEAVENHYKWVDAAKFLGCHSIRVNAASSGSYAEQMKLAADGLRRLTEYAAQQEMNVIVENHGGLSSDGQWLSGVMKTVEHERCGTLPDFGNFRVSQDNWYDRYRGVEELMKFAKAVSAKANDFDEEGNCKETDYYRMMKIVVDAGYNGFVGIEYEGRNLGETDGIMATRRLLEKVRTHIVQSN